MNNGIDRIYKQSENKNELIDLRNCVRNTYEKSEKLLEALISKKNHAQPLWHVYDFSEKIINLLDENFKHEEKENNENNQKK
jgi:hypothetical protein